MTNFEVDRGSHLQDLFYKTRPCRHFKRGVCWLGSNCCFAHSDQDQRERPIVTKTKLCKKWLAGMCCKTAQQCWFAHGLDDVAEDPQRPHHGHRHVTTNDAFQERLTFSSCSGGCTGILLNRNCLGQIEDALCTSSDVTMFESSSGACTGLLHSQTCFGQIEQGLRTNLSANCTGISHSRKCLGRMEDDPCIDSNINSSGGACAGALYSETCLGQIEDDLCTNSKAPRQQSVLFTNPFA